MKDDLNFVDIKKNIDNCFIHQGWVTVCNFGASLGDIKQGGLYSSLVKDDKLKDSLSNYSWELRYGNGRPGFESSFNENEEIVKYYRFPINGYEPLVYYREEFGNREKYLEFSEEFRLFHNLYEIHYSSDKKEYLFIDSNGDEEVVAKINKYEALVKLKFIKDYISAKDMHLLIYFDFMRFSEDDLKQLELTALNENYLSDKYFYNHIICDCQNRFIRKDKTQSWIMGKCLIKKLDNYKPSIWGNMDIQNEYSDFIIGFDEDGNEKLFSCNEEKLGNYFGKNPKAPQYVTPVYFSREVLKKYYDNPVKYSVQDGYINCNSIWSLRLDNSCKDYVIVLLGDLGKLHYKEQLYWKSFNIPPRKEGLSYTGFKRFFEGEPCDPVSLDLLLKMKYETFNENWNKKFGWKLFKPLSKEDSHCFKTLHLLTSDKNDKEFDEQILSLTKVFIDSINEKSISKEIAIMKENARSIDKLESFLAKHNLSFPDMITFFRNLQSLRSATVAHRRSNSRKDTQKILDYFEHDKKSQKEILDRIFSDLIRTLITLENHFIKMHVA